MEWGTCFQVSKCIRNVVIRLNESVIANFAFMERISNKVYVFDKALFCSGSAVCHNFDEIFKVHGHLHLKQLFRELVNIFLKSECIDENIWKSIYPSGKYWANYMLRFLSRLMYDMAV